MTVEEEPQKEFQDSIPFGLSKRSYKDIPGSIPEIIFIENVEGFLAEQNVKADDLLKVLQSLLQRLKIYESHVVKKKSNIQAKIPETKESISVLKLLIARQQQDQDTEVDYILSDQVLSTCKVDKSNNKVGLWLGANVMLEYSYEEALEMLQKNQKQGETRMVQLNDELAFVKTQITTTEVTLARVYNHDVQLRRDTKSN